MGLENWKFLSRKFQTQNCLDLTRAVASSTFVLVSSHRRCTEASDLRSRSRPSGVCRVEIPVNALAGRAFESCSACCANLRSDRLFRRHVTVITTAALPWTSPADILSDIRTPHGLADSQCHQDVEAKDWSVHQPPAAKPTARQELSWFWAASHFQDLPSSSESQKHLHFPPPQLSPPARHRRTFRRNGHRVVFVMPWVPLEEQAPSCPWQSCISTSMDPGESQAGVRYLRIMTPEP